MSEAGQNPKAERRRVSAGKMPLSEDSLKTHLQNRLARYKHPKQYRQVDARIRHDNGKVNYRAVRALAGLS